MQQDYCRWDWVQDQPELNFEIGNGKTNWRCTTCGETIELEGFQDPKDFVFCQFKLAKEDALFEFAKDWVFHDPEDRIAISLFEYLNKQQKSFSVLWMNGNKVHLTPVWIDEDQDLKLVDWVAIAALKEREEIDDLLGAYLLGVYQGHTRRLSEELA
jgi:hypothetical protein